MGARVETPMIIHTNVNVLSNIMLSGTDINDIITTTTTTNNTSSNDTNATTEQTDVSVVVNHVQRKKIIYNNINRIRRRSSFEHSQKRGKNGSRSDSSSALSLTPSLSSILNQRKSQKTNNNYTNYTNYHQYYNNNHRNKHYGANSSNRPILKKNNDPLSDSGIPRYVPTAEIVSDNTTAPQVVIHNGLKDLDLYTEYHSLNDIVQFYTPLKTYSSPENSHINNNNKIVENDNKVIELQNIKSKNSSTTTTPSGKDTKKSSVSYSSSSSSSNNTVQQRHQSLSPHFMLLYAIEQNMKEKEVIPELDVDEGLLSKLSTQDIWNLDIPSTKKEDEDEEQQYGEDDGQEDKDGAEEGSAHVDAKSIKLALITRKKLWCDMIQLYRLDTFGGKNLPWNQKFVFDPVATQENKKLKKNIESLVRLNSKNAPWLRRSVDNTTEKKTASTTVRTSTYGNRQMIKPCGVLSNGKTQYVVKGWCDSRFLQKQEIN